MATGAITKRSVDAIALPDAGKRTYLWDETMKGFGVMVTDKGVRSYLVQYRIGGRGAPSRRVTIGRHGSPWTPTTARDRAAELLELVRRKIDPFEADRERVLATRAATAEKIRADAERKKLIFGTVADGYIDRAKQNLKRAGEQERVIDRDLRPTLDSQLLPEITADDISDLLARIGTRSPSAALKAYHALRGVFAFAHQRHRKLFPKSLSPFPDVQRPKGGQSRERYLTNAELRVMWNASDVIGWPFGPIYKLLLLTGMRLREVAEGHWSEINIAESRWNVPASRTKNGRDHWVHLSPQALEVIQSLERVDGPDDGQDFIFTTTGGVSPVSGFSRAKSRLIGAMLAIMQEEARAVGDHIERVKQAPFVIHDTRRTIARGCQKFGTAPEVTERMLGHVSEVDRGIKGTYQVYKHEPERIEATNRWGKELQRILEGSSAKVVKLYKEV